MRTLIFHRNSAGHPDSDQPLITGGVQCSAVLIRWNALATVSESGFRSDCGAEKFFHIKCRTSGLRPDCVESVCTVGAIKYQSGHYRLRHAARPT